MAGQTKTLPARSVDEHGTISWDWDPVSVGLTSGHWKVEIVASANGERSTATDALGLTVVP